ncbi:Pantothenate kinase 4 [Acipenser ruthenus]|uniref:Pantothenate kinase 4 n=1 Tax=Acipenser ruthenus TaxID=7906 RepID=A0A444UWL5_ACIRT|nr:Pantothenate kinase 4 [Acipenser ruthenus]
MLEMDRLERQLVNLPLLLDSSSYIPDTMDLTEDAMAREYWLSCFEEALDGVVKRAVASQPDLQDARERAEKFRLKYRHKLQTLRHQPCAYGSLTIKQRENDLALRYFQKVVRSVEMLNWEDQRPWLVDSYSKWIERLKVVLASNSGPALNDVTYNELQILTERIAAMDSVIHRLDKGLATLVRERHTDLVVIEGMGRAIHTNYYAVLRCESLKLAVIKNSWLAERLGGKIYSVVFKYEQPSK